MDAQAFSLSHSHAAPPSRSETRDESAGTADYGVLRGVFVPSVLLRLPLLYRYVDFLRANGVRLPADATDHMPVTNEPTVVATGVAAAAAKEPAEIEVVSVFDELQRLRSELHGGAAGVEQRALQMVLCVGARADSLVLVQTALRLGGEPAPRSARLLRGHAVVNERGLSPLHIAAGEGHAHVVQMLLAASAPPTLLSGAGAPPLVVAAQSDHAVDALEALLQAGAPLAKRDDRRLARGA